MTATLEEEKVLAYGSVSALGLLAQKTVYILVGSVY